MLTEFIGSVNRHDGFAIASRYKVFIGRPLSIQNWDARGLSLFCDTTSLPSRAIETVDAPLLGFRQSVKYPKGYALEDITFSFYLTNNYFIKRIFDEWLNLVVDQQRYLVGYDDDYKVDIEIHQLNQKDEAIYKTQLIRAYPINVQAIELSNGANADPEKLSVTFSYEEHQPIK